MRQLMEYPNPGIRQSITPQAPCSEAQQRAPKTYGEVLRWPGLREGACELLNSLDNTQSIYDKPRYIVDDGGSFEAAVDQGEVFRRVMDFMDKVNYMLEELGNSVKCSGGGGVRSMSGTSLIVRLTSAHSSLTDMSRQVLATVLVKGDWDFDLKPGESLEDALNDPQRSEAITATVQEVCVDEIPLCLPLLCMINCHSIPLPSRHASPASITRSLLITQCEASSSISWPTRVLLYFRGQLK